MNSRNNVDKSAVEAGKQAAFIVVVALVAPVPARRLASPGLRREPAESRWQTGNSPRARTSAHL